MKKNILAVLALVFTLFYSWFSIAIVATHSGSLDLDPLMNPCNCTEPAHVTIQCDGNSWDSGTDFEYFQSDSGTPRVRSSQNSYGAFCNGYGELIENEGMVMICPSIFGSSKCDSFCTSQISTIEAAAFTAELRTCVSYFRARCDSTVTVEGEYPANAFSAKGWWVPYGLCDTE